jgi:hypothetical protein
MRFAISMLAIVCTAVLGWPRLHAQSRNALDHVTVPMSVEDNAPIVTLQFKRPNGGKQYQDVSQPCTCSDAPGGTAAER